MYGLGEIRNDDPYEIAQVAIEFSWTARRIKSTSPPRSRKIGIGVAFDGEYYYATQNFFNYILKA